MKIRMKTNSKFSDFKFLRDLIKGIGQFRTWNLLSKFTFKSSYGTSYLGPIWIIVNSLSFLVFFVVLRQVFFSSGDLKGDVVRIYIGYSIFTICASGIRDGAVAISRNRVYLEGTVMPVSFVLLKACADTLRIAFYSIIPIPGLMIWNGVKPQFSQFIFVAFWVVAYVIFFIGLASWLGLLILRIPDVNSVVQTILTGAMFITPIWWRIEDVRSEFAITIVNINPIAWAIQSIEDVFIGGSASIADLAKFFTFSLVNFLVGAIVMKFSNRKFIYRLQ
jgi:ABC-type polysaccharide/polyol phosphate export permease